MVPERLQAAVSARLHPDWRRILQRSWSFRLTIIAALLSGAEVAMSIFIANPPINPTMFAILLGLVTTAASIARPLAQRSLSGSPE